MLILQSSADFGARTVTGLWKFKNHNRHPHGIDFTALRAIGSRIAQGCRGFPGNLSEIRAGIAPDEELAFRFQYQPGPTEQGVPVEALERQFADFFSKLTDAYLGWEILSDETPQVVARPLPLPRENYGYWNNLPVAVYSHNGEADGNAILAAWGLSSMSGSLPSDIGDYVNWQRVGLPHGWRISLEGHDFLLVDQYNQVRGEICDALPNRRSKRLVVTDEDFAAAGVDKKEFEAAFASKKSRKELEKPRLLLRTSISFRDSFSLADDGPYSLWVENAAGQRLFGIYQQPITLDEYDTRMPQIAQRIADWLEEHYPDWEDHTAYWDAFPQLHAKWAEARRMAYSLAADFLADKSDEELHATRAKIGVGEQRTDYTLALQDRLSAPLGEKPPYNVAELVVQNMMDIFDLKIGRLDD